MVVTVILHASLQNQTQPGWQGQFDVTLLSGSTLGELIPDLGVELPLEKTVMLVNGQQTGPSIVLQDGDLIKLIPAIS